MLCVSAHPIRNKLGSVTNVNAIVGDFGFIDTKAGDQVEEIDKYFRLFLALEGH